jgi:hypothetical protein
MTHTPELAILIFAGMFYASLIINQHIAYRSTK